MADVGCRNTVFGAQAQQAGAHMETWLAAGIEHFRLEFVHESPVRIRTISKAFENFLSGNISSVQLQSELQRLSPQGTTEGSLFVSNKYVNII